MVIYFYNSDFDFFLLIPDLVKKRNLIIFVKAAPVIMILFSSFDNIESIICKLCPRCSKDPTSIYRPIKIPVFSKLKLNALFF